MDLKNSDQNFKTSRFLYSSKHNVQANSTVKIIFKLQETQKITSIKHQLQPNIVLISHVT